MKCFCATQMLHSTNSIMIAFLMNNGYIMLLSRKTKQLIWTLKMNGKLLHFILLMVEDSCLVRGEMNRYIIEILECGNVFVGGMMSVVLIVQLWSFILTVMYFPLGQTMGFLISIIGMNFLGAIDKH